MINSPVKSTRLCGVSAMPTFLLAGDRKGHYSDCDHWTQTQSIMAVLRLRRKRVLVVLLIACLFWLMYLLVSLPSKGKVDIVAEDQRAQSPHATSQANRVFTNSAIDDVEAVEPENNVIAAPVLPPGEGKKDEGQVNKSNFGNGSAVNKGPVDSGNGHQNVDIVALGSLIKNKTYELGLKLKNKTVEVGEKVKNKTLEQLAMIGVGVPKPLPQLIFLPTKWNLTVSFEDIGNIMKETQFLNKVNPLDLNGPILMSTRNRTANFTYAMPLKFGFCDCFDRYCVCCSQITNKRLHLNSTACSNFTFVSKTHELDMRFSLDGQLVHQGLISADKSPLVCIGSQPRVADICVHFFNMTFRVNEHNDHQTQLLGCTDLSLNLYNKTIGAFPVDCFQIPGDPNQVHKERKVNLMFNWVP